MKKKSKDLTAGGVTRGLLLFAGPMIAGNLLQQVYNITDTLIVGRYLGEQALAAVGSTYTLTTFLYSILIGLCMGCGSIASFYYGEKNQARMRKSIQVAGLMIAAATVAIETLVLIFMHPLLSVLRVPAGIHAMTVSYVRIIFVGIAFIAIYNFFAYLLRALGDSVTPLYFLGISTVFNIVLDIFFVVTLQSGVEGAAWATLIAQVLSGIGLMVYALKKEPDFRFWQESFVFEKRELQEVFNLSFASSAQQSVMNFGILMIQGLVNSFGTTVMAAFTVAVKIDTMAYMPAQEFANACSIFVSQNFGAGRHKRLKQGIRSAVGISMTFCLVVSALVVIFAGNLMRIFVKPEETEMIRIGIGYLRIEGACYVGIGLLFLFYGYFRGIKKAEVSLLLTVISLGTRVALAYLLAPMPSIGVIGIWFAIPIGWILADLAGTGLYLREQHETKQN